MTTTDHSSRYALSFTSGALLVREALVTAPIYLRVGNWDKVRAEIESANLLQARTQSSGVRRSREVVQRLSHLNDADIELLTVATPSERGHLLWTAACRHYSLIGQFAEEVLRERFLVMAPTIDYDDFDAFFRSKALWHEELEAIQGSTYRKLRSSVFRMLTEAGLVDVHNHIQPALLSTRVEARLATRTPSDVRFFPVRDPR